ncbi:interaptin-like [Coccinella septempunctata]|uniref:interaptin-like n=1 Tax=Coccinella septempunctata TaxID=41139 RepID=UPI001D087786|nr:interaptin-like [Coccinella septempunctata]
MEISTEFECETTQEIENYNEVCEEIPQTLTNFTRSKQIETQEQENNMAEVQEEVVENKMNIKQQIDLKSLIVEEAKQYIFMEEQRKITKSSMEQLSTKVQENIQQLRKKIFEEKNIQLREEIEINNENSKLLEMKHFTYTTKEILDALKTYVNSIEQQICTLKYAELEKKILKKYQESSEMINEKFTKINEVKAEITNFMAEYKATSGHIGSEQNAMLIKLKNEVESLKNDLGSTLQENQQLKDEITKIDREIEEKNEEISQSSARIKEHYEQVMEQWKNWNYLNSNIQEMELKRSGLLTSIESSGALLESLKGYAEDLIEENSRLEEELKTVQNEYGVIAEEEMSSLKDVELSDLEQEEERLAKELEELEKQMSTSKEEYDNLVIQNHDEDLNLLTARNSVESLRHELSNIQNTNKREYEEIEKLKTETIKYEEELRRIQDDLDVAEKELISQKKNKEQLETSLKNLHQELADENDRFVYKRNTLQPHLENKLQDLKKKLGEIEETNKEEKRKYAELIATNKKRNDQYNRLRNLYLRLKSSPTKLPSVTAAERQQNQEDDGENKEVIEGERSVGESSPKGILKSPNAKRSAPTTPTKNVKFIGVSPVPSSSSCDLLSVTNADKQKKKDDPFDDLKKNLTQRKRAFD